MHHFAHVLLDILMMKITRIQFVNHVIGSVQLVKRKRICVLHAKEIEWVQIVSVLLVNMKIHRIKRKCVLHVILRVLLAQLNLTIAQLAKETDTQHYYQIIHYISCVCVKMGCMKMANPQIVLNVTLNVQAALAQVPIV